MKLLSVAIPCYNSAAYMEHAIESLLPGGEEMEIIIVDDGSIDATAEIAKKYAMRYPSIVKAVHQKNGGHGRAVNTGLSHATGIFFKVVDSDDWADAESLEKVLEFLRFVVEDGRSLDMLICNYVYENVNLGKQKVMDYRTAMPQNEFFTWSDIKHFKASQYILMHSVFYRTKLLRDCGLKLPAHTFYVDNIFVYEPLPYVKNMYYLDVDFYRYFIGRDDQSVNEKNMLARIDQQLRITKHMIKAHDLTAVKNRKRRGYMTNYLCMMMVISTVFLIKSGTQEDLRKKDALWRYLKKVNPKMYRMVKHRPLGIAMFLPGKLGRRVIEKGYSVSRKIYGFS